MIRFFVCKDVSTLILNKTDEIQSTLSNMSEKTLKPSFIYSYNPLSFATNMIFDPFVPPNTSALLFNSSAKFAFILFFTTSIS